MEGLVVVSVTFMLTMCLGQASWPLNWCEVS